MKIIVIGGTGTLGKAVTEELKSRHEVIAVGQQHGDLHVNIEDPHSIETLFKKIGNFDAVVSTTGKVHFGEWSTMTPANYAIGLNNKLMGQVNLVMIGSRFISDHGSFTLTSGILSHDPIKFGSSASMVNGALDSFVKAASIELPRGIRINCVSPTVVTESMKDYAAYFRGYDSVPAARVALAYSKSVEGLQTGQIYSIE